MRRPSGLSFLNLFAEFPQLLLRDVPVDDVVQVRGKPCGVCRTAEHDSRFRISAAGGEQEVVGEVWPRSRCGACVPLGVDDGVSGSAGMVDAFPFNSATFIPHIGRVSTRPVPGHVGESTGTFALPVSKKRPGRGSWSTARLTAPRIPGAFCHSSISSGSRNDRSTASGSRATASAEPGRSSARVSLARLAASVVLPQG